MHLRPFAVALVAATMLLTGCAEESPPRALPTPSPAPTVGAFAESDAPEPEPPPETAKQFLRRWPAVETAMINSGKTDGYIAISDPACGACRRLAKRIEQIYQDGGFAKTKGWVIESIRAGKHTSTREVVTFVVKTTAASTEFRESKDSPVKRLPGGQITHEVTLIPSQEGWLLGNLLEVSTGS